MRFRLTSFHKKSAFSATAHSENSESGRLSYFIQFLDALASLGSILFTHSVSNSFFSIARITSESIKLSVSQFSHCDKVKLWKYESVTIWKGIRVKAWNFEDVKSERLKTCKIVIKEVYFFPLEIGNCICSKHRYTQIKDQDQRSKIKDQ